MGNAKFDGIYEACKEKKYKGDWQKLKGKKVILWTVYNNRAEIFQILFPGGSKIPSYHIHI